ncbi:squalene/phytoene synthase [Plasticicumulans lactativorans]|uniref:Squalene/phytoene synthase n=1 Tax=Plasticicumulans lactativorans TaxID=1133106 RepID=A0A4R2LUD8_9GAMM|nr:squalene/phytoene synthase family protein [Plasticicumulans lactativorans]TCO83503.1 squalene/phytoene synthase [Plasticicumulans lactativorans]
MAEPRPDLPRRLLPDAVFAALPPRLRQALAELSALEQRLRETAPAERAALLAGLPAGPLHDCTEGWPDALVVPPLPFATLGDLLAHAQRTWAPYAALTLAVLGHDDERARGYARAIAGALYLLTRLDHLRADCRAGLPYLAREDMARHRVTVGSLATGLPAPTLVDSQLERARRLLRAGSPLGRELRGRSGFALRLLILAADRWITAKRRSGLADPPPFSAFDWLVLAAHAVRHGWPRD